MKIWMVFACDDYLPGGGANDFVAASLESEADAMAKAKPRVSKDESVYTEVFDTETLEFEREKPD